MTWGLWGYGVPGPGERTAMPAPMPKGITFHYHPTDDTIPRRDPDDFVPWDDYAREDDSQLFYAPAVEARHNGNYIGHLEWLDGAYGGGSFPGEVGDIHVEEPYRRHGVGTALFDFARQHEPRVDHSSLRSALGDKWVQHERSRHAARSLEELAQAGYITDDWGKWQQGGCIEYAHALKERYPHLRAGVISTPGDEDDWQHIFMHDDTHAYDSAGSHPLPYAGVHNSLEQHLDHDLDWYDEPDPDLVAQAHQHIDRHGIGPHTTASRTAGANGDLPEVMTITHKHYPRSGETSWHAHHDGREIGTLWVMPSDYGDQGMVSNIDVHDDYQRRGVGTALWNAAGQPLHTPGQQSRSGEAWARAVGGDNDFDVGYDPDDDVWNLDDDDEEDDPFYTAAHRTAMPYYHNTDAELNPGDELKPASELGFDGHQQHGWNSWSSYDPERVYFTQHPVDPEPHPNQPFGRHTYEVEPVGDIERDPEWEANMEGQPDDYEWDTHDAGYYDYTAPRARVIRKINPKKARTMTAAVTVYTQPNCIQCTMTKKQLDKLGIEHNTVDVSADPEAHAYVTGLGYTAAPVVVVNDGESHWAGFRPDRLKELSGE